MGTVVKLEKPTARPRKNRGDSLIEHCVRYAQAAAASSAAFLADPDGDSRVAEKLCEKYDDLARDALAKIFRIEAKTPEELKAKAYVASRILFHDTEGLAPNDLESAFIRLFVDDVLRFLRTIVKEKRMAAGRAS